MVACIVLPLLAPFLGLFLNKMDTLLSEQYNLRKDEKNAVRSLMETLNRIHPSLQALESAALPMDAHKCINDLKEFLYSADDIVDAYVTEAARSKEKAWWKFRKKRFFNDIKDINTKIDTLRRDKEMLQISLPRPGTSVNGELVSTANRFPAIYNRRTGSAPPPSVLGRDETKNTVLNWFQEDPNMKNGVGTSEVSNVSEIRQKISILPIVGNGGIGKTTFAQFICDDQQVKRWFPSPMWVHVSEVFQVETVIRGILDTLVSASNMRHTLNGLQVDLQEQVSGRTFLLVLDDVWPGVSEDAWKKLLHPLIQGCKEGSKILVTGRTDNILEEIRRSDLNNAVHIGETLRLEGLPADCIQNIFNLAAFAKSSGPTPNDRVNAEEIKTIKELRNQLIKNRLKGSPLAAKTLGRILSDNYDVSRWKDICNGSIYIWDSHNTESSRTTSNLNDIMPVLYLSYLYLSPNLRPNFGYCSLFPKGHIFTTFEMGMLWMSCGFFQTQLQMCCMDYGKSPMEELSGMSLLDPYKSSLHSAGHYYNKLEDIANNLLNYYDLREHQQQYLMDDLFNDMAEYATEGYCKKLLRDADPHNTSSPSNQLRHLSVFSETLSDNTLVNYLGTSSKLRTLVIGKPCSQKLHKLNLGQRSMSVSDVLRNSTYLRVLVMEFCELDEVPSSIGKLIHLRYLSLKDSIISKQIPDSIGELYNLRFLNLKFKQYGYDVPRSLSKLMNLQYLAMLPYHFGCIGQIYRMTSLQLLDTLFTVKSKSATFGHYLGELGNLDNLRCLTIDKLEDVKNIEDVTAANLDRKTHLEALMLGWNEPKDPVYDTLVLHNLWPPSSLTTLVISNHRGDKFPFWLPVHVPKLQHLAIVRCLNWCSLPQLHQLSDLRSLSIRLSICRDMTTMFNKNGNNFVALKKLELLQMQEWKEIRGGGFIVLKELRELILHCPKLDALPIHIPEAANLVQDKIANWVESKHMQLLQQQQVPSTPRQGNKYIVLFSFKSRLSSVLRLNDKDEKLKEILDYVCLCPPKLKKLVLLELHYIALDLTKEEHPWGC